MIAVETLGKLVTWCGFLTIACIFAYHLLVVEVPAPTRGTRARPRATERGPGRDSL